MNASAGGAKGSGQTPSSATGAAVTCPKCGYAWTPRVDDPMICSKCGHHLEQPRKKKGLLNALRQFNEDANDGFV